MSGFSLAVLAFQDLFQSFDAFVLKHFDVGLVLVQRFRCLCHGHPRAEPQLDQLALCGGSCSTATKISWMVIEVSASSAGPRCSSAIQSGTSPTVVRSADRR